jgi:putative DNA primase/helicase
LVKYATGRLVSTNAYCGWVCWRYEQRTGEHKAAKVPYDPRGGRRASHSDSRTWRTFEEAVTAYGNGGYDGIGFMFSSGDPFTGVDLDGCRKPETGELEEWAERVIGGLGGYAEASPSGGGVHVIIRGRLPEGVNHKVKGSAGGTIEAYSERRFFTMTGRVVG